MQLLSAHGVFKCFHFGLMTSTPTHLIMHTSFFQAYVEIVSDKKKTESDKIDEIRTKMIEHFRKYPRSNH